MRRCLSFLLVGLLAGCSQQPQHLLRPNGVAVVDDQQLYVTDRGNYRIAQLESNGQIAASIGVFGVGPSNIHSGWDLGRDSQGTLYIGNFIYNDEATLVHDGVRSFEPDGSFGREFGGNDYDPALDEPTNEPYGVTVDSADRIWVANYKANRVVVYQRDGRQLAEFFGEFGNGNEEFSGLSDLVVDRERKHVYVVDSFNGRIQEFSLHEAGDTISLQFLRVIGRYGSNLGEFAYPLNIALDQATGDIYVGDMGNQRIQRLTHDGQPIAAFAPAIERWQVFGLAFHNNHVYAADAYNNTIWRFNADGSNPQRLLESEQ
ncbi:NHL repeat-containing protein [Herpetosiphon giganteus]|uniref:NHL repeat-containing protein n=1 Tax=Herpetosiphon giganteus TaxID=2029754 RepID=UPI001956FC74|nr:NHL repeat-containing protein [Herpetosiphon giganteus]MBM7845217.1 DNA-binding beta-propeller fold protein YncE [Herpetosiphon giganteus]